MCWAHTRASQRTDTQGKNNTFPALIAGGNLVNPGVHTIALQGVQTQCEQSLITGVPSQLHHIESM